MINENTCCTSGSAALAGSRRSSNGSSSGSRSSGSRRSSDDRVPEGVGRSSGSGAPAHAAPPANGGSAAALASDFHGLLSLKTGSGRNLEVSEEQLARARALLEAADAECSAGGGAAALPFGSSWPVVSLVTPDGLSKHAVQPEWLAEGTDLDIRGRDRSELKRGRLQEE